MTSPKTDAASKAPELAAFLPFITAVGTALAAWKLFEPKFAKRRAIKTELGSLEPAFEFFYVVPQLIMGLVVAATIVFLLAAFWFLFNGDPRPAWPMVAQLAEVVQLKNIVLVLLALGVVGWIIYSNVLSRLLLWAARILSWLPLPWIRGRFGPDGSSPGWHQATNVVQGPDKGMPLLIDYDELKRLSSVILGRLAADADSVNLAEVPATLGASEKANIALFGCILEAEHYANRWPSPDWSKFYKALADIQAEAKLFTPETLVSVSDGAAYFSDLATRLDTKLAGSGQPQPPEGALAAAESVASAWLRLKRDAHGDVLQLPPPVAGLFGSRLFWLDRRLRDFPMMQGEGMRPQLLKLLLRWQALPTSARGTFVQPFAKRQAWLLFHERVLRTLPEMKEVTFNGSGEMALSRLAALLVAKQVAAQVRAGLSPQAKQLQTTIGTGAWELESAADFILWDWAGERTDEAKAENWDKSKWPWKFGDGRVSRQG